MDQQPRAQSSKHRPKGQNSWAREYLPGYTGHVPLKNDLFGKTAGTINREICLAGGQEETMGRIALKQSMMGHVDLPTNAKINKDVFGNLSKFSTNWIAGPTHNVRRQQVPGYTGHVRGMVNKDSMSKSYARVTAALFAKKHPIEVDNTPKGRFTSTQRGEFKLSNNRRFVENKDMKPRRDYDDYSKYINEAHMSRKELLTNGIQMAASHTARPSKTSMRHQPPTLDVLSAKTSTNNFFKTQNKRGMSIDHAFTGSMTSTSVKPRILESKVSENTDFYNLSDGFKRIFADDK